MACLHLGLLGLQQPVFRVLCPLLAAWRAKAAFQALRNKMEKPNTFSRT